MSYIHRGYCSIHAVGIAGRQVANMAWTRLLNAEVGVRPDTADVDYTYVRWRATVQTVDRGSTDVFRLSESAGMLVIKGRCRQGAEGLRRMMRVVVLGGESGW
ncbi:hypothetical protein CBR_g63105 [Chara braunii]|uniref:Uncharacterized protein n=1 Tax=Chara braunii TaxID=69332 RepID=A0A388K9B3_CHABU|nr:hypothetical protein CBR_g63105 [Chara braunii]|eukprot:GBG66523.1 hypothetical protein CBR_g63105 [Chara braunii]